MKKIFFIVSIVCCVFQNCDAQNWLWAKNPTGILDINNHGNGEGLANILDRSGDLISIGEYGFAKEIFGTDTLIGQIGVENSFLCKQKPNGNYVWAKGGNPPDGIDFAQICADTSNDFFVTGYFHTPTYQLDAITLVNDSFALNFNNRNFIAKLDSDGNAIWAFTPGSWNCGVGNMTVDNNGNSYYLGSFFTPTCILGSDTLYNTGDMNSFLLKLRPNGSVVFAKNIGDADHTQPYFIGFDKHSHIYILGMQDTTTIVFGNDTLVGTDYPNIFLAKFDLNGNAISAKMSNGNGQYGPTSFVVDEVGGIYFTGEYWFDSFNYDSLHFPFVNGSHRTYVVKCDSNENSIWGKTIINGQIRSITSDSSGNIFLSGNIMNDTLYIDTLIVLDPTQNSDHMTLYSLSSQGEVNCLTIKETGGDDICDLALDKYENVYLTGDFGGSNAVFGTDSVYQYYAPGLPSESFFTAKYRCDIDTTCAISSTIQVINALCYNSFTGQVHLNLTGGLYPIFYCWSNGSSQQNLTNISSGNYFVTITDFMGCEKIDSVNLSAPADLFITSNFNSNGDSLFLNVTGGIPPYNFNWSTGATSSFILITGVGNYSVTVTDSNGCSKTLTVTILTSGNLIQESNFTFYPNPFSTQFTLELKSMSNISIYNLLGKKLIDIKNATGTFTLGEALSSGMYILEIRNQQGEISKSKIVKTE